MILDRRIWTYTDRVVEVDGIWHYELVKMVSRHLMEYGVAVELRQAFFPRWGWIFLAK